MQVGVHQKDASPIADPCITEDKRERVEWRVSNGNECVCTLEWVDFVDSYCAHSHGVTSEKFHHSFSDHGP